MRVFDCAFHVGFQIFELAIDWKILHSATRVLLVFVVLFTKKSPCSTSNKKQHKTSKIRSKNNNTHKNCSLIFVTSVPWGNFSILSKIFTEKYFFTLSVWRLYSTKKSFLLEMFLPKPFLTWYYCLSWKLKCVEFSTRKTRFVTNSM